MLLLDVNLSSLSMRNLQFDTTHESSVTNSQYIRTCIFFWLDSGVHAFLLHTHPHTHTQTYACIVFHDCSTSVNTIELLCN